MIFCSVYMISAEGDHSKSCLGVLWKCHGDTSTEFPSKTFEWSPSHWACGASALIWQPAKTGSKLLQAWQFVLSVVPGKGSQCNLSPQHINVEC